MNGAGAMALAGTAEHPHARMVLGSALASGEPSHAYLFHGPPGTGKRTAARALAAELLAASEADPDAAPRRGPPRPPPPPHPRAGPRRPPPRPALGEAHGRPRDARERRGGAGRLRRHAHAVRVEE